jgi:hypothetical protein
MEKQIENMTQEQALSVLVSAAKVAQAAGAFNLEDASLVLKAINTFKVDPETKQRTLEGGIDKTQINTEGAPDENPPEQAG